MSKRKAVKAKPSVVTALDFRAACTGNDLDTVERYIAMGGDVNETDKQGDSGLMLAVAAGHVSIVRALVAAPGIHTNIANKQGITAIHRACGGLGLPDEPITCQLLVAAGADPIARTGKGWMPIHYAIYWGNISILSYLISMEAVALSFCRALKTAPPELKEPLNLGKLSLRDAIALLTNSALRGSSLVHDAELAATGPATDDIA